MDVKTVLTLKPRYRSMVVQPVVDTQGDGPAHTNVGIHFGVEVMYGIGNQYTLYVVKGQLFCQFRFL